MAQNGKRDELVRFLDEKVFDPILRASPDRFSGTERRRYEDVRRSTENEKHRYHDDYKTAQSVKENYLSDLGSETGKKKTAELESLHLPTLPQIHDDFLKLCEKLGI